MRKLLLVCGMCLLCGCSTGVSESASESAEQETEMVAEVVAPVTQDMAFGVPCRYVSGEESEGELKCRQKEVRPEWNVPADGWDLEMDGDFKVIHQVYDSEDVLLLPMDYGSNTYKIIGLDGVEETECGTCPDNE